MKRGDKPFALCLFFGLLYFYLVYSVNMSHIAHGNMDTVIPALALYQKNRSKPWLYLMKCSTSIQIKCRRLVIITDWSFWSCFFSSVDQPNTNSRLIVNLIICSNSLRPSNANKDVLKAPTSWWRCAIHNLMLLVSKSLIFFCCSTTSCYYCWWYPISGLPITPSLLSTDRQGEIQEDMVPLTIWQQQHTAKPQALYYRCCCWSIHFGHFFQEPLTHRLRSFSFIVNDDMSTL